MTFGQLKLRITQLFPLLSIDIIEGFAQDRYAEILGELPWSRLTVESSITTVIGQPTYQLPADCRLLHDDAFAGTWGELTRFSPAQLNAMDPARSQTGTPTAWTSYMDDSSTPPRMQFELWPVADKVVVLPLVYTAEVATPGTTATLLKIWLQPAALVEGIIAKVKRHYKDYAGAQLAAVEAGNALKLMRRTEANSMGPAQMQLDRYFTAHRAKRWSR